MNNEEVKILLDRYKEGMATESELALLESWYLNEEDAMLPEMSMEERLTAVDNVWAKLEPKKLTLWPRLVAASAVLLVISIGLYFGVIYKTGDATDGHITVQNDIKPGSNKAQLILASGKVIDLNGLKSGVEVYADRLAYDDGTAVMANGNNIRNNNMMEMALKTPKGGTYKLNLPDGSVVWLNAASTLKFPASFAGLKFRKVQLSGEAYFEVKHDHQKPFQVETAGQLIEDLGTGFNVNAYSDEETIKTTLVEGSLRIGQVILKPGEQALGSGSQIRISKADLEESVGWKNGYFVFQNEHISAVMRKVSRWYNVDIAYDGEIPDDEFGGRVLRTANVSQLLKKLELTNKVHFKIQGRRITVTK
jgi:transmembrane sensor